MRVEMHSNNPPETLWWITAGPGGRNEGDQHMTAIALAGETRAYRQSVQMTIADVANYLQDVLGQKLTAYMTAVSEGTVGAWGRGEQTPRPAADAALRLAFRIFHLLQEHESPHTVRAWFVGLNPQLEDESPATAIREGRQKEVLVAARAFISGG